MPYKRISLNSAATSRMAHLLGTVLVAQATGARTPVRAAGALRQGVVFGGVLSIILTIVGIALAGPAVALGGATGEVAGTATSFLLVSMLGLAPLTIQIAVGGAMRGAGDTRTPMIAGAIVNVINIVGAWALAFGAWGAPDMGIVGAAWGGNIARLVGAILMVAMLIVPTVTARQLTSRLSTLLVVAGIAGAVVGSAGSLISTGAGIPTGPVIVLVGFVVAMSAILLAPGRGVVWKAHRVTSERRRALNEGVLIDLETALQSGPPPTVGQLASLSGRPPAGLRRALRNLDRAGVLRRDGDRIALSATGTAAVQTLFDRRELWSAWLENGWRIELPDAGEPDPRDLRASLGDDLTDELLAFSRGGPGE